MACKAEWQRRQRPVTREWLYQKYVVEGLGAPEIARLVGRDSKRVWEWLKGDGIPTRPRGSNEAQRFQSGHQTMVGRTLSDETRDKIRQARLADGRVPYLKDGVHHLKGKRGADTTNWKGGITPERQAVYSTPEWADAVKAVWDRDGGICRRCSLDSATLSDKRGAFHVHHIVSFYKSKELRCEPSNLVLLCKGCHRWTHSRANVERRFLE
jgi:hypothetical protein